LKRISREILFRITGIPFNLGNQVDSGMGIFLVIIVMLFWEFFLRIWEKAKFKYSIDWFLVKLNSLFGRKVDPEDPLSVQGILYEDMEPIQFLN